ncbi:Phosphoglycerol transferase MdoB [Clostridium cavendishii DSM 21758]|uniref:Phosphoglycerol transferase MdoB n=1 Tax=Clostridium cavendishii DSM 21758 TaxID=1121302 RepID=A0A1M6QJL2_9CLOT|nr:LTA synthase family protein [Clostridium cavendishii]SHK20365.1 Phosphoglycerol transferase MdoB [Clostridium cavendishii DSM 21758]
MREKNSSKSISYYMNKYLFVVIIGVIIQLKSMIFLAMLRAPESASIKWDTMYFTKPPIAAHIACIILILSFSFLFKEKGRNRYAIIINLIVSVMLLADINYYRVNGTFLSIRHILHPEIFNPLGKSLMNFKGVDVLFFIDLIALIPAALFMKKNFKSEKRNIIVTVGLIVVSIFTLWYSHDYIDVKDKTKGEMMLFRIAWAPFQTMSNMSPLGYHGYDIMKYSSSGEKLTSTDKEDINQWFKDNKETLPDNKYKDMLKGKNVIAIQVESLENFVIGKKAYDQEITPNLNKLMSNSIYFNNIYEQNNIGTSSDCDLLVNTSVFPLREGSTFFLYPWRNYNTLPKLLSKQGYTTISSHPEVPGNWNWSEAHKSFKFDKIRDISEYNKDEIIGLGLSDGSYMKQIAGKLKDEKEPFYSFFVTLTSHGPFDMPEDKKLLKLPKEFDQSILGAYFQSVRYVDEQIGMFLNELKKNGQLDNTAIMIYGDHTGVHKFYQDKLKDVKFEGDWWQKPDMKIPFLVYNPGIKGEVVEKAGGQVDFLPTISYMLGIDRKEFENTSMGRVLVNTERNSTILNYGDIKGTPKDEKETKHLKDIFKVADMIIKGDYLEK